MTTHEVLVAARNKLDLGGWRQGTRGEGRCALGAIPVSIRKDPAGKEAFHVLREVVGDVLVFPWNDAPGRTKEEVLAAFDEAIARTAPPPPDLDLSELAEAIA